MSAKPTKDPSRELTPPELAAGNPPPYRGTASGYDFYLQSLYEIHRSIGSIESTITHLGERSQIHESKLDELVKDVHGAKRVV